MGSRTGRRAVAQVICFAGAGVDGVPRRWGDVYAADVGAFGGVGGRDCFSEARGGAGDEGGATLETAGHSCETSDLDQEEEEEEGRIQKCSHGEKVWLICGKSIDDVQIDLR